VTEEEACAQALPLIPSGTGPITLSELEQHMATAADLMRGAIEQADFKA
jgi:type I restriction enzyme M protein